MIALPGPPSPCVDCHQLQTTRNPLKRAGRQALRITLGSNWPKGRGRRALSALLRSAAGRLSSERVGGGAAGLRRRFLAGEWRELLG